MSRPAILLDRDGTLNVRPAPHHYVTAPQDFVWLPGAREALAELSRAGYVLAVVSNQRGIARGLLTDEVLRGIERRMRDDLGSLGVDVAAFRYCPHELDAGCACRKPRPGLLLDVARDLDLDLERSWMVGDSVSDVEAGRAAGCRTAYVGPGDDDGGADIVAASLEEFAGSLLADRSAATP